MYVVHFTEGATDPLQDFGSQRARFVPLADGGGDTHVSCLYLDAGAQITEPPCSHDCALLIVHGELSCSIEHGAAYLEVSSGMSLAMKAGERFKLESAKGAIVLLIESEVLAASERGISAPDRISGQRWPGEPDGHGGTYAYPRGELLEDPNTASPAAYICGSHEP